MASYSSPSISGYNQNPPPDDGSQQASNEVTWDTIKTKLPDPIKDYADAINSATATAFGTIDSQILNSSANYAADTGAADAYVVTLSPIPTAYVEGMVVRFKAANANTGASTINVNGIGAKNITTRGAASLPAGYIVANGIYTIVYDGTQFKIQEDESKGIYVNRSGGEPAISTTILQFTEATLLEDTWEGIGPTGSGEANIWAALDSVPTDADWIQLYVRIAAGSTTQPTNAGMAVHMRANGSSAALDNTTEVIRTGVVSSDETTGTNSRAGGYVTIQVASAVFDIAWDADQPLGSPDSITIDLRLTGYGYN